MSAYTCSKCGSQLYLVREIGAYKIVRCCKNPKCSLYNYEISFSITGK